MNTDTVLLVLGIVIGLWNGWLFWNGGVKKLENAVNKWFDFLYRKLC